MPNVYEGLNETPSLIARGIAKIIRVGYRHAFGIRAFKCLIRYAAKLAIKLNALKPKIGLQKQNIGK